MTCVLADDHPAVRAALRLQVERLPWIRVIDAVPDGATALEVIEQKQPHVAVLDVRMPGLTGFDVCERVRQRGLQTKVLLFSALAGQENEELGDRVGAAGFISKEEGFEALRRALEQLRDELEASS